MRNHLVKYKEKYTALFSTYEVHIITSLTSKMGDYAIMFFSEGFVWNRWDNLVSVSWPSRKGEKIPDLLSHSLVTQYACDSSVSLYDIATP